MSIFFIIKAMIAIGTGFAAKTIATNPKIKALKKELQKAKDDAKLAEESKQAILKQMNELNQNLLDTRTMLNDSISTIKTLKSYESIDKETQNKIQQLQDSFKDGKASDETKDVFKKMIEDINKKNSSYNQGK